MQGVVKDFPNLNGSVKDFVNMSGIKFVTLSLY